MGYQGSQYHAVHLCARPSSDSTPSQHIHTPSRTPRDYTTRACSPKRVAARLTFDVPETWSSIVTRVQVRLGIARSLRRKLTRVQVLQLSFGMYSFPCGIRPLMRTGSCVASPAALARYIISQAATISIPLERLLHNVLSSSTTTLSGKGDANRNGARMSLSVRRRLVV